ncbi:MAG: hypothetical protein GXP19_08415 [Gammaproteobacteria bacterium]|nr:hypothetical protein [Gammaproteobacteria bacterium]
MKQYNYDNLCEILGEKVMLKDDQGKEIELTIAEVYKGTLDGDDWEAFSVIYHGRKDFFISQGVYTFTHEKFGDKSLFLSPKSETEYETVVTRKRSSSA